MKYVKTSDAVPYSLHDSRITEIQMKEGCLQLDAIYQYEDNATKAFPGKIEFTETDPDNSCVYVFDSIVESGAFSGRAMGLQEYREQYKDAEFEILTEGYAGYSTTYIGWIWRSGMQPVSGIMCIWTQGKMIYSS